MRYERHVDKRGFFQELSRIDKDDILQSAKQIAVFSIAAGEQRGGHYHAKTTETFIILEGSCEATLEMPANNWQTRQTYHLQSDASNCFQDVTVTPWIRHTFTSKTGCLMLVVSDRCFNPKDTDTFVE